MSATGRSVPAGRPLDVGASLAGKELVVLGGTGFLGKVWLALILTRYPEVGRLHLLVRARDGGTPRERFRDQVARSEVFGPLREALGDGFDAFLDEKVDPVDGDVRRPECGLAPELVARLRGRVHAVVNVAGVVDFSPPLDEALEVNAVGVQNLVSLARALGDVPVMHTSTCYVAGNREGEVKEVDPRAFPFPRAAELGREHWDPAREVAECVDLVREARRRCDDAFRQSGFVDEARANLRARNEPEGGAALDEEVRRVRRKFVERELVAAGTERATFWGWPNIYTYTKAIGEQVLAASGLRVTIVRPAIIESSVAFPFAGWNEGVNTSAPLIWGALQGLSQLPAGERTRLDVIPVDLVATGMLLALAALIQGAAAPVYQLGTSDSNPVTVARLIELTGLYKRQYYEHHGHESPLVRLWQRHTEPVPLSPARFELHGAPAIARAARGLARVLDRAASGPAARIVKPAADAVARASKTADRAASVIGVFMPFMTGGFVFSTANVRSLHARLTPADRDKLPWRPEAIDWRHYWLDVHCPGLARWVFPEITARESRPATPARRYGTLVSLLDEMAARHEHSVALQRLEADGLSRTTYRELREGAHRVAARLQALGVSPGDRVLLSGHNHPDWPVAYFGVLAAGAAAVPVDPALEPAPFANVLLSSEARVALWDAGVDAKSGHAARQVAPEVAVLDLHEVTRPDATLRFTPVDTRGADVASLIYTSGTTGTPKGVMLTHDNFTSLVAALMPVFPLTGDDRVLSVLPLHHTFEFSCGMLLPLASGARVIYLDQLDGERLSRALALSHATAMVGVPALWQMLERKIVGEAERSGALVGKYLEWGGMANRWLGQKLGLDLGKVLFATVHRGLGGRMRLLVSGGAALPASTHQLFAGLGLHLAEGYGLTEAAPVLTVAKASARAKPGTVGRPLPGVEVRVADADASGVGEVVARGPNVMLGYAGDPEATRAVVDDDGWLHTGDLGRIGGDGRLTIVGRKKDVIVDATGENVYPDDVENLLGPIPGIAELVVVGVSTGANDGGERVGLLARPEEREDEERPARMARAEAAVRQAVQQLPPRQRPAVIQLYDAELPRTATRKVKRREARIILERIVAAATPILQDAESTTPVRAVVASLARKKPSEVGGHTRLVADLGLDSLAMLDLVLALEQHLGSRKLPADVARVETVGELEKLLGEAPRVVAERSEAPPPTVPRAPEPVRAIVKRLLGRGQRAFHELLDPEVTGRAFIPHNRNTIVIANHASHLDMGLVKHALGSYGEGIVTLAAADYFFDDRWKRAYFENFTNLAPLDRKRGISKTIRAAGEFLAQGKTVLVFPEGTRSTNGCVQPFKRLFAQLALAHGVDILPIYLRGTFEVLPKGAALPRPGRVGASIGPALRVADLLRLVGDVGLSEQARRVTEIARWAVESLRDGLALDLGRLGPDDLAELGRRPPTLAKVFGELEKRFQKGAVEAPVSFYFALGDEPDHKWTCTVDAERCVIRMGKPERGVADCVLKTSPATFTRIVREAYTPGVEEFVSGAVKSNDVGLLGTFQRVFGLGGSGGGRVAS